MNDLKSRLETERVELEEKLNKLNDYLADREIVNQQMKERAIKAFVEATDGYFIVGGTDYTHSILEAFKSKLSE